MYNISETPEHYFKIKEREILYEKKNYSGIAVHIATADTVKTENRPLSPVPCLRLPTKMVYEKQVENERIYGDDEVDNYCSLDSCYIAGDKTQVVKH